MRDWDVWQRHKDYNSVIALACEIPKETIGLLERAGFIVDDGSKPSVKADQLFILHIRDLDKKHYWAKFEQFKGKYGEEPKPVHLEEMPELVMRFLGDVTAEQSISIANYALKTLLSGR
jgi:hypothetical protein